MLELLSRACENHLKQLHIASFSSLDIVGHILYIFGGSLNNLFGERLNDTNLGRVESSRKNFMFTIFNEDLTVNFCVMFVHVKPSWRDSPRWFPPLFVAPKFDPSPKNLRVEDVEGFPWNSVLAIVKRNALPKFNSSPLKIGLPKRKGSSPNHHFSGASC